MHRAVAYFALGLAWLALPRGTDSYQRQTSVDVLHYVFRIALRDDSDEIRGETTVRFRLLRAGVDRIDLDFATPAEGLGMTVASVTGGSGDAGGAEPLPFFHHSGQLSIGLPQPALAGSEKSVTVRYSGIPAGGLLIGPNRFGERTFYAENWPDQARRWLPVVDDLADKATGEWIVTAPAKYQVVANGLLVEETPLTNLARRTHWSQSVPISPWLFAIGVARFAVHDAGSAQGVALQIWSFPQDHEAVFPKLESAARAALDFFAERLGPYPYEKLANVEAAGVRGGMENASAIFYNEAVATGQDITNIVAHEVAHQWFGDSVTARDWNDVWLSEGFATYCALLFAEHSQGREAFVAGLKASRERLLKAATVLPDTPVRHRNLSDMKNVVNDLVYQKGAWTLHMLRRRIGVAAFWRGMRAYYERYRDRNASTEDFRRVMEEASGVDLGPFLRQWLERGDVPRLGGRWRYDAHAKQVEVTLEQTQDGQPFRLPVEIGFGSPSNSTVAAPAGRRAADRIDRIERVDLTVRRGTFRFPRDTEPSSVSLDPETELLFVAEPFLRQDSPDTSADAGPSSLRSV